MNELLNVRKIKTVLNAVLLIVAVYLAFIFAEQYREMYPILAEAERLELIQQNFVRNVSALSNTGWSNSSSRIQSAYSSDSHFSKSTAFNSYRNEVYSTAVFENVTSTAPRLIAIDNDIRKSVNTKRNNKRSGNNFQIRVPALKSHHSVQIINKYVEEHSLAVETKIATMQRPLSMRAEDDPDFPGDPGELPLTHDLIILSILGFLYLLFIHFKINAK